MESSNQQMPQHLSYPNPSLGDTAGFAAANLAPRDSRDPAAVRRRPGPARQVFLIISLLLGLLLATLDTSVIATSLTTISEEFHDHANGSWILLAYLLSYMGCSVGVAKLSDIFGRRMMLFYSWGIFLTFSACCAGAPSMQFLIASRAFKGIGGAGLYSLTQICLLEHGPAHRPGLMGGLIGFTLALAFLLGPVLGGAITARVSWRWIFAINLPLGFAALLCILFCFPREIRPYRLFSLDTFKKIDIFGMFTLLIASGGLVFAVERAGTRSYSWNHPGIILSLIASGLSWITFGCWETYLNIKYCEYPDHVRCMHMEPVFTARLAQRRPYMFGLAVTFLTGIPYLALVVIIPERMEILQQENPLNAGVHLIPMLTGCAVGSFLAGAICRRRNHTSFLMIMSAATQLLGIGLMLILPAVESSFLPAYGFTLVFGLGAGLSFGAATILGAVETESTNDIAVAQGAIAQARVLGSCLGVAACAAIFNDRLDAVVDQLSPEQLAIIQQTPTASASFPEDLLHLIQEVYSSAFRDQTIFMMVVCGIMLIAALLTWESSPRPISCLAHAQQANKTSQQQDRYDNDGTELSDMASVRSRV